MKRTTLAVPAALVAIVALAVVSGASAKKPTLSATPVFKLSLKPSQEVPRVDLKAKASGHVTFDLTRDSSGAITAGEVVFYFNYSFPGNVVISGLHIHQGAKGTNGGIVVNSGVTTITDSDGVGNVTTVVTSGFTPATLQAILDNPRNYYVNLHTTTPNFPGGAVRAQMHNPKKG
jgi:CHRD domain